jgi:hypothetical protein
MSRAYTHGAIPDQCVAVGMQRSGKCLQMGKRPLTLAIRRVDFLTMLLVFTFAHGLSEPVALIAMMFSNEENGMRVNPFLVSKEAAQRSGRLPTLTPFR